MGDEGLHDGGGGELAVIFTGSADVADEQVGSGGNDGFEEGVGIVISDGAVCGASG